MREECSFQTSLLPVNTNYMFLSTILQHNDNFKFNTGKNNEYNDQSSNNKKIVNSRLYGNYEVLDAGQTYDALVIFF